MRVSFAALTDVGCVRRNNEDAFLVADLASAARCQAPPDDCAGAADTEGGGLLVAVADGMGGALAGEVAASMAIEALRKCADQLNADSDSADMAQAVDDAIREANSAIYEASQKDSRLRGMGTTLTAAFLRDKRVGFYQVGDSRGFVVRKGAMRQMTKDHSLIGRLIDDKVISPADAERMEGGKNIILQALGAEACVHVDYSEASLGDGDLILLCTDGLHGCVKQAELDELVGDADDCEGLCKKLVEAARQAGGPDNISVVGVAVESGGAEDVPNDPLSKAGRALRRWLKRDSS